MQAAHSRPSIVYDSKYFNKQQLSADHYHSQSEAALSTEAIAYWTSFASSGDPSTERKSTSLVWTKFAEGSARSYLELTRGGPITTNSVMKNVTDAQFQRCQFWMTDPVVVQTGV